MTALAHAPMPPLLATHLPQRQSTKSSLQIRGTWAADLDIFDDSTPLIEDLIPAGVSGVWHGPPGEGKTATLLDACCHLAAGIPKWRGLDCERVPVAYLYLDGGISLNRRVVAWCKHNEIDRNSVLLHVVKAPVNFLFDDDVDNLIDYLIFAGEPDGGFRLLVVDTLARAMPGGDENSSGDVGRVVANLDRIREEIGLTWIVVHHSPKHDTRSMRGSSALLGAIDLAVSVDKRMMVVEKSRDGESGQRMSFDLKTVEIGTSKRGKIISGVVAIEADERQSKAIDHRSLPGAATVALDALKAAIEGVGVVLPSTSQIPPGKRGVVIDQWRTFFARKYGEHKNDEATRKAFGRAKEVLFSRRIIGIDVESVWIW